MKLSAVAAALLTAVALPRVTAAACAGQWFDNAVWTSENGNIMFNGQRFKLRGGNWAGLEMDASLWLLTVTGNAFNRLRLHQTQLLDEFMALMDLAESTGINAVRVPLAMNYAMNLTTTVDVYGYTYIETLTAVLDACAAHGMVVMLDMHRVDSCCDIQGGVYMQNELPTDYGYDYWRDSWINILNMFGGHPAVFAIDIFNEPHGVANWGLGGDSDWYLLSERLITDVLTYVPSYKGLFFVEGVSTRAQTLKSPYRNQWGTWWAQVLEGTYFYPIQSAPKRIVYSPHTYGPSIYFQPYFNVTLYPDFPANLAAIYDLQMGWIEGRTGSAMVMGEFGGMCTDVDKQYQWALADWCRNNEIEGFLWNINGFLSRVNGLISPKYVIDQCRLTTIQKMQPYPTQFTNDLRLGGYCYVDTTPGAPTPSPTMAPTAPPTSTATIATTRAPTTAAPTTAPTTATPAAPPTTAKPTASPTATPTTAAPTMVPTPTAKPTVAPTSAAPTTAPTVATTTAAPTVAPTTAKPTVAPTTAKPTTAPTTGAPTGAPTTTCPSTPPTAAPTTAAPTTAAPTKAPTAAKPTSVPTTACPTTAPTTLATAATATCYCPCSCATCYKVCDCATVGAITGSPFAADMVAVPYGSGECFCGCPSENPAGTCDALQSISQCRARCPCTTTGSFTAPWQVI